MRRCMELAKAGMGEVAPNPMVGAVLVHEGRIIGEGYHRQYGKAHAEVNCIESVKEEDVALIPESTLYVSLEPCAHFGKTPPCTDLIIRHRIPHVVIGCTDPFSQVNGKGIEKLQQANIQVTAGVLEKECRDLNRRFFTFHEQHRPYIILKWAQSSNGKIAGISNKRIWISNAYTNRLVHRWRSEETAILVGTRTAMADDPALTTRLWPGKNPVRLVIDLHLKLPGFLHLFDNAAPTIVFNLHQHTIEDFAGKSFIENKETVYYQVTGGVSMVQQVLHALYGLNVQSVLVEGGARLLQHFIDEGMWDEARVITNNSLLIPEGLGAPVLPAGDAARVETLFADSIRYYYNSWY
ncbi:MAG: bifunctional diaminohydroxyphosphoribosylaminopyrimidine deaminase/5-amino-6-(5-phosphoribosylamino)uracil reductase RibD [Chitinophagaceae bacterium]|nr:bifunctional diaminohydroxyphosphoribosylaminopyrimidine deaminase/5-amino-6-(5-phosphoribosylamino)uracil reductase RibD [Chitinophagaceae bacterium]